MKKTFTFLLVFFVSIATYSQSVISGTLSYNGANYPCDVIEYNIPPSETEQIIKDRMKSMGFSPEKGKGYLVYRGVTMSDLSFGQPQDLIFKIDKKSKKESDVSVVSLITAKPGEVPLEKVKGAGKTLASITPANAAGDFLLSFKAQVDNQAHALSVIAKSDEIKKAEKKLDGLKKDQSKLEKKIKDAQAELQSNINDQATQSAAIEALKQQLEVLKQNQ